MFHTRPDLHLDPLWALSAEHAVDPRTERLDLIIGVYRDESGVCPVMSAVHEAERRLLEQNTSKAYLGLSGNLRFNELMTDLLLSERSLVARATTIQTVAGTGALRLLSELLGVTGTSRKIYLGTPAYVNHASIFRASGLNVVEFVTAKEGRIDLDAIVGAIQNAAPGDVLLIQGCCHNPTGLSMPNWMWDVLGDELQRRGVIPFIDQAYFGLGDGLDEDLAGMRRLLAKVPYAVVSVSASKAWGLYNERAGCAIVLTDGPEDGAYARRLMEVIARAAYSQPPAHGAQIVAEILGHEDLRKQWRQELDGMRMRLTDLRESLVRELDAAGSGHFFDRLGEQRGMFLRLPFTPEQMNLLRMQSGVYGIPSGRLNIAGVSQAKIPYLAESIHKIHSAAVAPVV